MNRNWEDKMVGRMRSLGGVLLASAAVGACQAPAVEDPPTWYADVKPIVDAHCGGCHVEGGLSPFSLLTYEEAAPMAALMAAEVTERTMPPWGAASGPSLPALRWDVSLDSDQIDTIVAWAEGGAREGDPADEGPPLDLKHDYGVEPIREDVFLQIPEPYAPGGDEYRCFVFDWPEEEETNIVGYSAKPDNLETSHHIGYYMVPPGQADVVNRWQDEAPGMGYPCVGSIHNTDDPDAPFIQSTAIGGYAPIEGDLRFPYGAGVPVQPGSALVMQMHYYEVDSDEQQYDQSSVVFELASEVERHAMLMPWIDMQWLQFPETMEIPPGAVRAHHSYQAVVSESLFVLSNGVGMDLSEGFVLHAMWPHMHALAVDSQITLVHEDGTEEVLLRTPNYDWDWQRLYWLEEPVKGGPGAELRLDCWFDNTAEWREERGVEPTEPEPVYWSDDANMEMCSAALFVTEPL